MRVLRHPRRDRPKPRLPLWRLRVKHDASYVLVAVEHVVIVIRPLAGRGYNYRPKRASKSRPDETPRGADNVFVFLSRRAGGQLSHNATYDLLKTLRPAITLHGFRSTLQIGQRGTKRQKNFANSP